MILANVAEIDREKIVLYLLHSASDIFDSYISNGSPEDTFIGDSIDSSIIGIENRMKMTKHLAKGKE